MYAHGMNKICSITKCASCDGYYLYYRYARIHLDRNNLYETLMLIYEYENQDSFFKFKNPFCLKFGLLTVTVNTADFDLFKEVVEETAIKILEVPDIKIFH